MNGILSSANSMMQGAQNTMQNVAQGASQGSSLGTVDLTKVAGAMMESKANIALAVAMVKMTNELSSATLNILA